MKKTLKKKDPMVCIHCGEDVMLCDSCPIGRMTKEKVYFCGNCGDRGSHVSVVKKSRWIKAQKLLGLK